MKLNTHVLIPFIMLAVFTACSSPDPSTEDEASTAQVNESASEVEQSEGLWKHEHGMLQFKYSGMMSGGEVWYWTDHGMKQRKEMTTSISMMGITQNQNTTNVIHEDVIYTLNEEAKTATKMVNDVLKGASKGDLNQMGYKMLEEMGGKKVGEEEFFGKSCEVWEIPSVGSKVWFWEDLPLRSEVKMMGQEQIMEVVEMDLNAGDDEDLYDVSGYDISEGQSVNEILEAL